VGLFLTGLLRRLTGSRPFGELLSQPMRRILAGSTCVILIWLALASAIVLFQRSAPTTVAFEIAVRDAAPGDGALSCFYYDTGSGFSEQEKTCFQYLRRPLDQFQRYQITIRTDRTIRALRFDPLAEPGSVALRNVTIEKFRIIHLDLAHQFGHSLYSLNQAFLHLEGDTLIARLETSDPNFMLADNVARLTAPNARVVLRAAGIAFLACLALFAVMVLGRWTANLIYKLGWLELLRPHRDFMMATASGWTVLFGVILIVQRFSSPVVSLQIAVREITPRTNDPMGCFFYDTGNGFNPDETTCFDYDQSPVTQFQTYRISLPTPKTIKRLRFDPLAQPGVVAFRALSFEKYGTVKIAFPQTFERTLYALRESTLTLDGDTLVAHMETDDPQLMLSDWFGLQIAFGLGAMERAGWLAFLICFGIVAWIVFMRATGLWSRAAARLASLRRRAPKLIASSRAMTWAALASFLLAVAGAKVFVILTSAIRLERAITLANLAAASAEGLAISVLGLMAVLIILAAESRCAGRRWTTPFRLLFVTFEPLVALALTLLALFEILCCYVFWEWGSYVDGSLLRVAYESPTPDSVHYYLTRTPAAFTAIAMILVVFFGAYAFRMFRRRVIHKPMVLAWVSLAAVVSLTAVNPIRHPNAYDPSVSSPIILALQYGPDLGEALDPTVAAPDLRNFQMPPQRPVPSEYLHLHGAAAGQDVIFVVLESVRRADVSLYGYPRDTTPNLKRLSNHAIVFSNAYISQPRSCKTLESFTLGTYPDPRYNSLTWEADRLVGRPSFWGTLVHNGYRGYFGVNADTESDGFGPTMRAALGPALDRSMGLTQLFDQYGEIARPAKTMGNDTVLTEDFLQWYRAQPGKSAAMLWFVGAHHPYWATTKKFPEHGLVDQYDNCIYSADLAVDHLIAGIEKTGKHPLVLIFGDHGESFGEHAGDQFHGRYLYNYSVRIPMMLYSPSLFHGRQDFDGRFSTKDIPATLLYLLGKLCTARDATTI
jgi:glucan phosphoethanolaminetransferase (alkaline phosphatase superfamily)